VTFDVVGFDVMGFLMEPQIVAAMQERRLSVELCEGPDRNEISVAFPVPPSPELAVVIRCYFGALGPVEQVDWRPPATLPEDHYAR
jgi:hypothetical protein